MSVRLTSASSQYLDRTASVFNYNAAHTMAGWVYIVSPVASLVDTVVSVYGTDPTDVCADRAVYDSWNFTIPRWRSQSQQTVVFTTSGGSIPAATGAWYYISLHRTNATQIKIGVDGTTLAFATDSVASRAASTQLLFGASRLANNGTVNEFANARLAYWRAWTTDLTDSELALERISPTAVKTDNLWASWPLVTHQDLSDVSGNGRHLKANGGALTTEADPPAVTNLLELATPLNPPVPGYPLSVVVRFRRGALPVFDRFDATQNPLAGNWTTPTGFSPVRTAGGVVRGTGATLDCGATWNADTFASNHYSKITVAAGATSADAAAVVRCQSGTGKCYAYSVAGGGLRQGVAYGFTTIETFANTVVAGDTLELRAVGSNPTRLYVLQNGAPLLGAGGNRYFDDAQTGIQSGGAPGVFCYDDLAANSLESWEGGNA